MNETKNQSFGVDDFLQQRKENEELKKTLQDMVRMMHECIEELTIYIDAEYPLRGIYRDETRKHERDMDVVLRATSLILKAKEQINER